MCVVHPILRTQSSRNVRRVTPAGYGMDARSILFFLNCCRDAHHHIMNSLIVNADMKTIKVR